MSYASPELPTNTKPSPSTSLPSPTSSPSEHRTWIRLTLIIVSVIVLCIGTIIGYVQSRELSHIFRANDISQLPNADAVMILGASIKADHTPSDALRDRLDTGIAIYRTGRAKKILLTGDDGEFHAAEIEAMQAYVQNRHIPETDVLVDGKGYRTYESCKNAKNDFHINTLIVVTQRFHLGRALYLCNALDIQSVGVTSDPTSYKKNVQFWIRDLFASAKAWWDINIWHPASPVANPAPTEPTKPSSEPTTTSTAATTSTSTFEPISEHVIDDAVLTSTTSTPAPQHTGKTQYVLLAFDGSYSIPMWKDTRAFAAQMTAEGKPIHYTYFISGVYLLTNAAAKTYQTPHAAAGSSAIGFGGSKNDIANRIEQINLAIADGHEIGSHANGHYDGHSWSQADWKSELTQFDHIVKNVGTIDGLTDQPSNRQHINLPPEGIIGFRAPDLGVSAGLWPTLRELGYTYDASRIAKPDVWPTATSSLWEIPLAKITYANTTSTILSMDYNFYFKQSGAKDLFKKGTPEWDKAYADTLTSFNTYFDKNYAGTRAPVQIGNHFSTWNDGVYWEAMKTFAARVCGLPDVKCTSMKEMVHDLSR